MKTVSQVDMVKITGGYTCAEGVAAFWASGLGLPMPGGAVRQGWLCQFGWAPSYIK